LGLNSHVLYLTRLHCTRRSAVHHVKWITTAHESASVTRYLEEATRGPHVEPLGRVGR
jgi:hypothetical protein